MGDDAAEQVVLSLFSALGLQELRYKLGRGSGSAVRWPRFEVVLDVLARYVPSAPAEIMRTYLNFGVSGTHLFLASHSHDSWLWLTTNFDNQIEISLEHNMRLPRVIADRQEMATLTKSSEPGCRVIKLHGDISIGDEEINRGVRIDEILRQFPETAKQSIASLAADRPFLCVGYAARDPDLKPLIRKIVQNSSVVIWIGLPDEPEPNVRDLIGSLNNSHYCGGGFALVIQQMNAAMPASTRETNWSQRVEAWAKRQDPRKLALALAALCLQRNDPVSREIVPDILRLVTDDDPMNCVLKCDIESDRLARYPHNRNELLLLAERVEPLTHNANLDVDFTVLALTVLAECYFRAGDLKRSVQSLRTATQLRANSKDPRSRVRLLRRLGYVQLFIGQEELQNGIDTLREAVRVAREADLPQSIAFATMELAVGYTDAGDATRAREALESIRAIIKELDMPRHTMFFNACYADILRLERKWSEAAKKYEELLGDSDVQRDHEWYLSLRSNYGHCQVGLGRVIEAERAFEDVLTSIDSTGPAQFLGYTFYYRGWLRVALGVWSEAIKNLRKATDAFKSQGSTEGVGGSLALIGWCELRLGHTDEARKLLRLIHEDGLVPAGAFAANLKMLRWALDNFDLAPYARFSLTKAEFALAYEQKFLILAWVLESIGHNIEPHQAEQLLLDVLQTIKDSNQVLFSSVIRNILEASGIVASPNIEAELRHLSQGDLRDLRTRLLSLN